MAWQVRVLGLPGRTEWNVTGLPEDAAGQDAAVAARHPGWQVERIVTRGTRLLYRARPAGAGRPTRSPVAELSVAVAGGPDAGRLAPLPRGGLSVGRGSSRLLLDDGAAPSAGLDLHLHASGLRVSRAEGEHWWDGRQDLPVGRGRLTTVRGPQQPLPTPSDLPSAEIDLGSAPGQVGVLLPLTMAVAPLLVGLVLLSATGNPLFLLFGMVSLLGAGIMTTLHRRARRRHILLLHGRAVDTARRRARAVSSPEQVTRALRSRTADRLGLAGAPTQTPPLLLWGHGHGRLPLSRPDADDHWQAATDVAQPAVTALHEAVTVYALGAGREREAAARWALVQMLRHAVATHRALLVTAGEHTHRWWAGDGTHPLHLQLPPTPWAAAAWTAWSQSVPEAAAASPPGQAAATVRFGAPAPGGPSADVVVDLDAGTLRAEDGADQRIAVPVEDLAPLGISETTLLWWLDELAEDVLALSPTGPARAAPPLRVPPRVGTRSAERAAVVELVAATGAETPLCLDLAADGPHVLIAGTTGSGKSDLLLSVLVGLTAHHPPAELALILLDFKGGASFGPLAGLPHVMSLETNHVGAASLRALAAIRSELHRREALFAQAGVPDYPAYRRLHPDRRLPRLVVAVDELRVLMDEQEEAGGVLQRLAATGRSLGFHLVLATQRAAGAVGADVRSNIGATIALRTATEQESWDLVGSREAALLDPAAPGSGLLALGGGAPVPFRASVWAAGHQSPVWWPAGAQPPEEVGGSPWSAVVQELRAAYDAGHWPRPAPVVSPGLPDHLPLTLAEQTGARSAQADADGGAPEPDGPTLALLDDTARARHVHWRWPAGADGGTAWVVEPGGGRAQVLAAVVAAALAGPNPVLGLDGTGELTAAGLDGRAPVICPTTNPGEAGDQAVEALTALAETGGTVLLTGWSAWSGLRVGESYRSFDEELQRILTTGAGRRLRVGAVGGRDLASSRLMLHLPHRFYVPAGTSTEHRLVWPRLAAVEPLPARAVHVCPAHPEPGLPAQLAVPAAAPGAAEP
ncbi:FtsK/SpoIIIE domain-containing protein [Micrococcus sp.]|uniref:FtsK/SpoIIIE domain-containing protein n=1 Tax=Micrococcus sp. TaxID=1271 RepID=UPI002A91228D|nr:FtsK/SpoIIIE domain-containing protein [Micrococcus sp.]MDY6055090.1 FtsK/SpoIIIE domain-containing protein [Micrococcus sp.]